LRLFSSLSGKSFERIENADVSGQMCSGYKALFGSQHVSPRAIAGSQLVTAPDSEMCCDSPVVCDFTMRPLWLSFQECRWEMESWEKQPVECGCCVLHVVNQMLMLTLPCLFATWS